MVAGLGIISNTVIVIDTSMNQKPPDPSAHLEFSVATGSDGRPPRRKSGFEKRQLGSIRHRFAALVWLGRRTGGTIHAGDIMAVNLKTLNFSPLPEFLLGTATPDHDRPIHNI